MGVCVWGVGRGGGGVLVYVGVTDSFDDFDRTNSSTFVKNLRRLNQTGEVYLQKPWYRFLRKRWFTNIDALDKFYMKIRIHYNETGEFSMKYEDFPIFCRAIWTLAF